jgi:hypothetical protein
LKGPHRRFGSGGRQPSSRALALALLVASVLPACSRTEAPRASPLPLDVTFAQLSRRLSEPGGFFASDNIVSNETSYLHVLGRMRDIGVNGGVYIGVGPDQNFSYIAQIQPDIAFIIDIRRDNLLQHLLYKALFERAASRMEYLGMLLGRPAPPETEAWDDADIGDIVAYFDGVAPDVWTFEEASSLLRSSVQRYGLDLTESDLATIRLIHEAFFERGLDIRYSWSSRHPTWRRLLLETDLDGNRRNYLATEESFKRIKEMEATDRIVPVVGDLAGPHALAAIGREALERGLLVRAFYLSNVEQYLFRGGTFDQFARTVSALPHDEHSVLIRSYFGRRDTHPLNVPGHTSTQLLERFGTFTDEVRDGGYRGYYDVVRKNVVPLMGEVPAIEREAVPAG